MVIIGISAFYHDSAACILIDGHIIAAAQEERFTRIKHDARFPSEAIKYCLKEANISAKDVNFIVFYEKPLLKFERLLETYLAFAPIGFTSFIKAIPVWLKEKLFQKSLIVRELEVIGKDIDWRSRILFSEHHLSHAASAFYPSGFNRAAVLTLDGVGEWATSSIAIGKNNKLEIIEEINFPHSLGLLYSAFTYFCGFKVNSGEYKLMGLAPYGKPVYSEIIRENLINLNSDGSFSLNMEYFSFATGLKMTNRKFAALFGGPPRKSEAKITQREMDMAASIQKVLEEIILTICKYVANKTGEKNLCLAGGVALNCVANGVLLKEKIFKNIWIQPAAGDAGGAIGAAFCAWHLHLNKDRKINRNSDLMNGAYLGPEFNNREIREQLETCGAKFCLLEDAELIETTVRYIADGKAVGWLQGRMEFGPRALGNRSILGDPRSPKTQKLLNLKVKFRESFRPFAPSILKNQVNKWFDLDQDSPYMLIVAPVKKEHRMGLKGDDELFGLEKLNQVRSRIPAVTHVDYSARIQTVDKNTNKKYHDLLTEFLNVTGCPILVNTSFNVRGEPIVCSPTDAFKCFMGTDIDALAIGNFFLIKDEQSSKLIQNYEDKYELD